MEQSAGAITLEPRNGAAHGGLHRVQEHGRLGQTAQFGHLDEDAQCLEIQRMREHRKTSIGAMRPLFDGPIPIEFHSIVVRVPQEVRRHIEVAVRERPDAPCSGRAAEDVVAMGCHDHKATCRKGKWWIGSIVTLGSSASSTQKLGADGDDQFDNVWGDDPAFLAKAGEDYRALVREQELLRVRGLLVHGRTPEAREGIRRLGAAPLSYRLLSILPATLLVTLLEVRRRMSQFLEYN